MADEKLGLTIKGDTLKNLGVALTIATTLFGVIKFATGKVAEYDSYSPRIAKLEAMSQTVVALGEVNTRQTYQIESNSRDLAALIVRIEGLNKDMIQLRIDAERLRTLLERK